MASILLLGSDVDRTRDVRIVLRKDGHQIVRVRMQREWKLHEHELRPDVIVAPVDAPEAVLQAPGRVIRGFAPPLLLVQRESDLRGDLHVEERLVDCITTPFLREDLLGRVDALVRVRRIVRREGSAEQEVVPGRDRRVWTALGRRLATLIGRPVARRERSLEPYLEVAARVAEWADRRDAFEPGHAARVTSLCSMIAEALHMSPDETSSLLRAAMLHDIGKVALPATVLRQREPLDEGQMRMIRTHPQRGATLLRALDRDEEVAAAVLYHHERPDGTGYYGMEGDRIPPMARVLAVAEAYDAMTSTRIKQRMTHAQAVGRLRELRGHAMDSDCVDALVDKLRPRPRSIALTSWV